MLFGGIFEAILHSEKERKNFHGKREAEHARKESIEESRGCTAEDCARSLGLEPEPLTPKKVPWPEKKKKRHPAYVARLGTCSEHN